MSQCPSHTLNTTTDGTQACSISVCQAAQYCSVNICMNGCVTENNCARGQYCDLSNARMDTAISKQVGTCQTPISCSLPDLSTASQCPTYKINTTTDGRQACIAGFCSTGFYCSTNQCLAGCLNENNCAPGQYCDMSTPTMDPFLMKSVGTCQTPAPCFVPDFAVPPMGPDIGMQVDMTTPCGVLSGPCCAGGTPCGVGLMCYAGPNVCGPPCGSQSSPCCPTGQACMGSLVCYQGSCTACGTAFAAPCCTTDPACGAGLGCGTQNTCEPCGQFGQVCCSAATKCNMTFTCQASNTCM
jgi:hypothetical protein